MAFFLDDDHRESADRRRIRVGWTLLFVAILGVTALAWVPSPYVIQQPGATFDTLGEVTIDEEQVVLIEVPGETVYDTEGSLTLLTVGIVGSRSTPVPWLDVVRAWFDQSKAVIPVDVAYPQGQTVEQSNEENQALMRQSQQAATAAALRELGYEVPTNIIIRKIVPDSPAEGQLQPEDVIVSANGEPVADAAALQNLVKENGAGQEISFGYLRAGVESQVALTPAAGFAPDPIIGVSFETVYEFPFEVHIQLEDVGGPSAGMMFALGIIDKLTPGAMTGGESIAGTGTVADDGTVGPIGGIRQKLYGADYSGAAWFLAPERNCDEVVGHVPEGLSVFSVATLDDAIAAVEAIASGDTAGLATCEAGGSA